MKNTVNHQRRLTRQNVADAKRLWPPYASPTMLNSLKELTRRFGFRIASGNIKILDGGWYVTHTGLLGLAHRRSCTAMRTEPVTPFCDALAARWVFRAAIYKHGNARPFIGYGDADTANVSPAMRGSEMRIAETRAVNRALRKAYGVGLCSIEELGSLSERPQKEPSPPSNGTRLAAFHHYNSQPVRLRDQLSSLIREHNLDPNLVKAYAAEFCGTETLRAASRELVESFVQHLATSARADREGLLCKLNSFTSTLEARL